MKWRVYYDSGATFSDDDGPPEAAPPLGVQAITQVADPAIGRRVCSRFDFYWFEAGEWHGSDQFGLWDYLQRVSPSIVKFGRVMSRLEFEAIVNRAVTDPDLAPKVAWDTHERR